MKIAGSEYSEKEARDYTATYECVNSARRIVFTEGKAKGLEAIEVICGGGLELLVLTDRGLDIAAARYKGVNIGFLSKNGLTGRQETDPHEDEFLHYFTGGLLTTCGLRNAGPSCREESGEYHPLHGRISTIGASEVCLRWKTPDLLEISGILRETALFGHQLKLVRTITVNASESTVSIRDELENESARPEEYMLIYHCNFGFPFLQQGCRVEFEGTDRVIPRTEAAKSGMDRYREIEAPADDYPEQVFFHLQQGDGSGRGHVRLVNPMLSLACEITQSLDTLPVLAQWKSMQAGDYALGLEPCNHFIKGRVAERANGTLRSIAPGETVRFEVDIAVREIG